MSIPESLFYFFAALAGLSAFAILFTRNVFYGALLLLVCLLALAAIYVLAFAEFVAVTQILVYAGGVLVLIIFGIMLTAKVSGRPLVTENTRWAAGLLVGLFFLGLLVFLFSREDLAPSATSFDYDQNVINLIGIEIMTNYVLPFEVAGILLLITLIGAAVMAADGKEGTTAGTEELEE